jgi:hypothetical protein
VVVALAAGLFLATTHTQEPQPKTTNSSLHLASSSLAGDTIPRKFTCDGAEISPELSWTSEPEGTQSFALIVTDRDSFAHFVHWVVYNIPSDKRELPEATPKQGQLPDGTRQGKNNFDNFGYGGPCPPMKATHHYGFVLYALDSQLSLPPGATAKQAFQAMMGHLLGRSELVTSYHR